MGKFQNKTVYITGGSSGIGLAIAGEMLADGAKVLLIARRQVQLEAARATLVAGLPASASAEKAVGIASLDIASRADVMAVIRRMADEFQPPDILINCAGTAYPDHFVQLPDEQIENTIRVNLLGTIWVTKACLPYLLERKGAIGFVSSVSGFLGIYGYTAYSASKFGIMGFCQSLRMELKPEGVQVSVICPSDTRTPQLELENLTKPEETRILAGSAGLLEPEEVAKSFMWGFRKGKFLIIPGLGNRLIYLLNQVFPGIVRLITDGDVKKYRKKAKQSHQ